MTFQLSGVALLTDLSVPYATLLSNSLVTHRKLVHSLTVVITLKWTVPLLTALLFGF